MTDEAGTFDTFFILWEAFWESFGSQVTIRPLSAADKTKRDRFEIYPELLGSYSEM